MHGNGRAIWGKPPVALAPVFGAFSSICLGLDATALLAVRRATMALFRIPEVR